MITTSKIIPLILLSVGIFLLMQIITPIISFQLLWMGQEYNNVALVSPTNNQEVLGVSIQNENNFPAFISYVRRQTLAPFEKFSITIPKLRITNEIVEVDSNDLSAGLVHLPGSALPGEKGNVFVSGHSALSQLFSLKTVVFASLPDLKKGDEIIIEAVGTKFKYQVMETKLIDPKDLSIINPPDNQGRYLTLMTCFPPGLNFKRLIVLGKMI